MTDDGFQIVTRKKWIGRKKQRNSQLPQPENEDEFTYQDASALEVRIKKAIKKMAKSKYYAASMATLNESLKAVQLTSDKLKNLLCLGIGRYAECKLGLQQLAFILKVKEDFQLEQALFFDPVFNSMELEVLNRLGCSILPTNTEGKHLADVPMIYYLPHCSHNLSNNILWANWRPENLANVVLISNSFSCLIMSKPESLLRLEGDYILKISKHVKEMPLDDSYEYKNIFNDLSVHVFPKQNLDEDVADDEFWAQQPAPTYDYNQELDKIHKSIVETWINPKIAKKKSCFIEKFEKMMSRSQDYDEEKEDDEIQVVPGFKDGWSLVIPTSQQKTGSEQRETHGNIPETKQAEAQVIPKYTEAETKLVPESTEAETKMISGSKQAETDVILQLKNIHIS